MANNVPIFRLRDYLIAVAQTVASDEDLLSLRDRLAEEVGRARASGVVLDVTGFDVIDSFSARILRELVVMLRLRGAPTVIVGIQPEVAFAMVQLGLRIEGVATALDLEEGIAHLDARRRPPDAS